MKHNVLRIVLQLKINKLEKDARVYEHDVEIEELKEKLWNKCKDIKDENERKVLLLYPDLQERLDAIETQAEPSTTITPEKEPLCGPETQWRDIKITREEYDWYKIKTPEWEKSLHYAQLGMANKRTNRPRKIGEFFEKLVERSGVFTASEMISISKDPVALASQLNEHMKKVFGIDERIYKYSYKTEKRYVLKLEVEDKANST